jgi:protein gp37
MQPTDIEWCVNPDGTRGHTWNPVTGCEHDCKWCYARPLAHRLKAMGQKRYRHGFAPTFHEEALEEPGQRRKPTRIFVCSMADLFGAWVPTEWIQQVLQVVQDCPQHTFIFLTKNPRRLLDFEPWPDNTWVGATVVDQVAMAMAAGAMHTVRAPVRFLSVEPMLGPVELGNVAVDWLIIGDLNRGGRPAGVAQDEWVADLTGQARRTRIPVFHKDSLAPRFMAREFPAVEREGECERYQQLMEF